MPVPVPPGPDVRRPGAHPGPGAARLLRPLDEGQDETQTPASYAPQEYCGSIQNISVCPRGLAPFYIVTFYMKWVKNS